ncbi:tumor necrosis factor alpha-induced protein 3-like [Physella acuta]|uniref:tumor necrosis factor alpha-induced protein 3-like n=1 Tax=Physella acuta TaxID=109671 RepID=UPI0027DBCAD3|nr:tumor necrosis factor alpha-induced protein 3-like [Physella acuta]XP_059153953.1 tumor necrosis factor alpha-induced protein 3-like [Physella acuta]XP_059153954.1 tumor necrosis factor alpha-induced protein 3-like [Physella acuta]XP_059153955.1 tumor necrosis factor alpha-induced protein 3-like [Physella acuta]
MYTNPSAAEIQRKKLSMQQLIKSKIDYSAETKRKPYTFSRDFSHYDCQLPALKSLPKQLEELYAATLLDNDMMADLTARQLLNWPPGTTQLFAVAVPRDGNCLLHAASVAVWGVDDSLHVLRELLLITITNDFDDRFKSRWCRRRVQEMRAIAQAPAQMIESEWADIVGSVSPSPLSTAHKFLEPIHVYVLANMMRRPILVVADSLARSVSGLCLQENTMAGIYLPLEWRPEECCPTPIILGYNLSHFCPLLTRVQTGAEERVFPLVTNNLHSLPILFLTEEEELKAWQLVQMYFQTKELTNNGISIPCAQLGADPVEKIASNVLMEHFKSLEQAVSQESCTGSTVESQQLIGPPSLRSAVSLQPLSPTAPPASGLYLEAEPMSMLASRCINKCGYRSSSTTFPYCHQCFTLEQDKRKQSQQFLTPTAPFSISQLSIQESSATGSQEMSPPYVSSLGHISFVKASSTLVAHPTEVSGQILQPALTGVNNLTPVPGLQSPGQVRGRGKACVTAGCPHFGDPAEAGMCSSCYRGHPGPAQKHLSMDHPLPNVTSQLPVSSGLHQKHLSMDHPLPNVTSQLPVSSGLYHSGVEATSSEVSFKLKHFSAIAEPAESLQAPPRLTSHPTSPKPFTGQTPHNLPVSQTPLNLPVSQTHHNLPASQTPLNLTVSQTPLNLPVSQTHHNLPVSQTPLNLPVSQTPLNLPVSQTPLNLPVSQTPLNLPVSQTPLNLPVSQTPLNLPVSQTHHNLPVSQTPLNLPVSQTPLNLPVRNKHGEINLLGLQLVKCRMSHCQNYGSDVKKGYCNACFRVYREQSLLLHNAKFGQDVPDFSQ